MRCLLSVMLIVLGCVAYGQSLFVGIKGGAAINTAPYGMANNGFNSGEVSGKIAYMCGFKAGVDLRRFQAGLGIDYGAYKYQVDNGVSTNIVNTPIAYPHVFGNYKINMGTAAYVYTGVNAGFTISGDTKEWDKSNRSIRRSRGKFNSGLSGGVQAGISCPLTKKLHLQAEAGARYLPVKAGVTYYDAIGNAIGAQQDKPVFTIPITVGFTYKL